MLRLLRHLVANRRPPDAIIGGEDDPYLLRWHVIPRNRWFNIYLHHFLRSDDPRALHDHPWWNVSWILEGAYTEIFPQHEEWKNGALYAKICKKGDIVFRRARDAHRIGLHRDMSGKEQPVWTLFITGPKVCEWGFWCPKGWRHWKEFTSEGDSSRVGRGCDE